MGEKENMSLQDSPKNAFTSVSETIKKKVSTPNWEFSRTVGEVLESRHVSETHISGGGTDSTGRVRSISSSTEHYNRCRILWDNGKETFRNLHGDYSVGDKVFVVWAKDKFATDVNIGTGKYTPAKSDPTMSGNLFFGGLILSCLLIFVLIGIPMLIALLVYTFKRSKAFTKALEAYVDECYTELSEYYRALRKVPSTLPFRTDFRDAKKIPHYWKIVEPQPGVESFFDADGFHLSTTNPGGYVRTRCPFTEVNKIGQPYQVVVEFSFEAEDDSGGVIVHFNQTESDELCELVIRSDGLVRVVELQGELAIRVETEVHNLEVSRKEAPLDGVRVKLLQFADHLEVHVNDAVVTTDLDLALPEDPSTIALELFKDKDSGPAKVGVCFETFELSSIEG